MPAYHFHPSADHETVPTRIVLFSDAAAGRIALSAQFPAGCDVWQGTRYVGHFNRGAEQADEPT